MANERNISIDVLPLGELAANCYLVARNGSSKVVCIDPRAEGEKLVSYLKDKEFSLEMILLTHAHVDHIGAVAALKKCFPEVPLVLHREENLALKDPERNLSCFFSEIISLEGADKLLEDGETFEAAGLNWTVLWTPGHTSGGACYLATDPISSEQALFTGDTLFKESIGRTDFPGGSYDALLKSLKEKLFTLPPDLKVYPGHGEDSSIGYEIENNPYSRLC